MEQLLQLVRGSSGVEFRPFQPAQGAVLLCNVAGWQRVSSFPCPNGNPPYVFFLRNSNRSAPANLSQPSFHFRFRSPVDIELLLTRCKKNLPVGGPHVHVSWPRSLGTKPSWESSSSTVATPSSPRLNMGILLSDTIIGPRKFHSRHPLKHGLRATYFRFPAHMITYPHSAPD
jgi:hypothetical protein